MRFQVGTEEKSILKNTQVHLCVFVRVLTLFCVYCIRLLTFLAGSRLTNPVAATMLPAPSTVLWATLVTPETTAPPTLDTPVTVFPATVQKKKWREELSGEERG